MVGNPGSPTIFTDNHAVKILSPSAFPRLRTAAKKAATGGKKMSERSFRFTHAIVRRPAASATAGIRAIDSGAPDIALMRQHHDDYVAALKREGATVTELPDLPAYPDAQFVEDTALCLPEGAVVMRPGVAARLGEAAEMAPTLQHLYDQVLTIQGPGTIEGGDILTTESEILVGQSARTNSAGIAELTGLVARWGYRVRELQTPPGVLHFKTDCSLLDGETILSRHGWLRQAGFRAIRSSIPPRGRRPQPIRSGSTMPSLFRPGFRAPRNDWRRPVTRSC
jgi:N-dimethylarginine dimethylaminohydrolase